MHSSSQIVTTNKPTSSFVQAGCPSCRPTNSFKALKGKISHSMDLLTPSSPGGLPTLSLTTNSYWLPWGRVAMPLISPPMPVLLGVFSIYWFSEEILAGSEVGLSLVHLLCDLLMTLRHCLRFRALELGS